jgi:hypothetical protein
MEPSLLGGSRGRTGAWAGLGHGGHGLRRWRLWLGRCAFEDVDPWMCSNPHRVLNLCERNRWGRRRNDGFEVRIVRSGRRQDSGS